MRIIIDCLATAGSWAAFLRLRIALALVPGLCACSATPHATATTATPATTAAAPSPESETPEVAAEPEPQAALVSEPIIMPDLVEFGRGSGRDGLATVSIDGEGVVTIHRAGFGNPEWERGTVRLSAEQRIAIAERIYRDQIYAMDGSYSAGVMDGWQFVLRLIEGDDETVVYCDNQCPPRVDRFIEEVNRMVEEAGRDGYGWTWVRGSEHDDALWDAVRRLRIPRPPR